MWREASTRYGVERQCPSPAARCSSHTCLHSGQCLQQWADVQCDCAWTTYGGRRCEHPGTSYDFDGAGSALYLEYPLSGQPQSASVDYPSTAGDELALAFQTAGSNGVGSMDFLV